MLATKLMHCNEVLTNIGKGQALDAKKNQSRLKLQTSETLNIHIHRICCQHLQAPKTIVNKHSLKMVSLEPKCVSEYRIK